MARLHRLADRSRARDTRRMTSRTPIIDPSRLRAPTASAPAPTTLPLYEGILLSDVHLVESAADASAALKALLAGDAIGFDTESKPTFAKGEVSNGPHLVQLATDGKAYLFPITANPALDVLRTVLESPHLLKVGFGLRDDLRRLQTKLGIRSAHVLDLAVALRQDERGDVGTKTAVARFFGQRLQKSKKTSTTNWSNPRLTERQMLYAANDAHVALLVYRAWQRAEGIGAKPAPARERVASSPTWSGRLARFWSRLWAKRAPETGRDR